MWSRTKAIFSLPADSIAVSMDETTGAGRFPHRRHLWKGMMMSQYHHMRESARPMGGNCPGAGYLLAAVMLGSSACADHTGTIRPRPRPFIS